MVYYILPFYHFTHIQNHPQVEDWEGKNCKKHTSLLVFVIPLLLWWSCGCTCFEHRHSFDKGFALPLFLVTLDTSTLALEQPTLDWKDSPPDRFWWHLNIRHATFMWIMAQWHGSLAFPLSTTGNSEQRTADWWVERGNLVSKWHVMQYLAQPVPPSWRIWPLYCNSPTHRHRLRQWIQSKGATVQMRGCATAVSKVRGAFSPTMLDL